MADSNIALEIEEIDLYQYVDTVFTINAFLIDRANNNQRITGEVSNIKVLLAFEGNASIEHRCREHHPNLLEVIHNSGIKEDGHAKIDLKIKDVSMNHERQRFVIYFECYRPHGDFNIISAISTPIICIRYKLVMSESYTMPYIWYKDEGAKDKCIKILVKLMDSKNQLVADKVVPLLATLIYSSGQAVQPNNVLTVFHDKDRLLSIGVSGSEVVRFRVNEVSRNHRKQLFHLSIVPDILGHPELFEVAPAKSIAFEVKSKRTSEARNLDPQAVQVRIPATGSTNGNNNGNGNWEFTASQPVIGSVSEDEDNTNGNTISNTNTTNTNSTNRTIMPAVIPIPYDNHNNNSNNSTTAPLLMAMANHLTNTTNTISNTSSNCNNPSLSLSNPNSNPNHSNVNNHNAHVLSSPTNHNHYLNNNSTGPAAKRPRLSDTLALGITNPALEATTDPLEESLPPVAAVSQSSSSLHTLQASNVNDLNIEETLLDAPLSALRQVMDWTQATCHLLAASVLPTINHLQANPNHSLHGIPPCNAEHVQALLDIYQSRIQGSFAFLQSYFAITEQYAIPFHQQAHALAVQQQTLYQQLDYALHHFTAQHANNPASSSSSNGIPAARNPSQAIPKYTRQFFIPPGGGGFPGMNNRQNQNQQPHPSTLSQSLQNGNHSMLATSSSSSKSYLTNASSDVDPPGDEG